MRRHFAPGAAGTSEHQVAAWVVEDLQTEVAELRGRGVAFEEYESPGLRTVDGIATTPAGKGAWFKVSEGNVALRLFATRGAEPWPRGRLARRRGLRSPDDAGVTRL